jgi:predicted NBD/HSP70 family sugar kinase
MFPGRQTATGQCSNYEIIIDYSKQLIYDAAMIQEATTRTRIDLGRANRRAVLREIVFHGSLSRTEIASRTGLTGASVSRITRDLLDAGLISERRSKDAATGPGRRFVDLSVNPLGGYVLGIGLNLFQQSVSLADLSNRVIERVDLGLPSLSNPNTVIDRIVEVARSMLGRLGGNRARLLGGSIAATGAIDPERGTVKDSPTLGWCDVELGGRISDALGIPMIVENLPNSLVLAETHFGVARGFRHVLMVNCALGMGVSYFANGSLLQGRNYATGIGVNIPARADDLPGTCLDDVAGGLSVLRRMGISPSATGRRLPGNVEAHELLKAVAAADDGDPAAVAAISAAGRTLGTTLAQFAGLVAPELIMLAGPMASAPAYVAGAKQGMDSLLADHIEDIPFKLSATSPQASARQLAISEFLVNRDLDFDALRLEEAS